MTERSGNILRPLLSLEKKEILSYLEEKGIEFKLDKTNTDITITRNYLRENIIPLFQGINPKFKENIENTLNYFEDLKANIDRQVQLFLIHESFFYVDEFLELTPFLQKEVIRSVYATSNHNSTIGLSEANINEVIRFIKSKGNYTKKEIKHMRLSKQNNIIKIA